MKECKLHTTSMVTRQTSNKYKRNKLESDAKVENCCQKETKRIPYREDIGRLMYLSNATRPDITHSVNYLARRQVNPTEEDWLEIKRILRYLRGTAKTGLIFRGKTDVLEALTDASFRDCINSASTSGYLIKLYRDTISWRNLKQTYVSLSTCQAEYLAMSEACQEIISIDKSIRYIIGKTLFPVTMWCNNKSAGNVTKKDGSHKIKMFDESLEVRYN